MSFEKLATVYVFCADYHEGQSSRLYRILSKISSKGLDLKGDWNEWRSSDYYHHLVNKYSGEI